MKIKPQIATASIVLFLLGWSGCSSPKEISCATMSFRTDIIPILKTNCATVGCHTGSSPQKNLSLDSAVAYQNLSSKGYFTAGSPQYSIIYERMTSTSSPMPQTGILPSSSTDKIYCWIKQGGNNN